MEGPIVIGALEGWGVGDLDGEGVVGEPVDSTEPAAALIHAS